MNLFLLCLLLMLAACGGEAGPSGAAEPEAPQPDAQPESQPDAQPEAQPDAQPEAQPDAVPEPIDPACDTAGGAVPEGLVELSWDDGEAIGDVTGQTWEVVGVSLKEASLHEVVRFELDHPARIHALSVQFGSLPSAADEGVELSLFGDFGYNGFDFWQYEPLWSGLRCSGNLSPQTWGTYVLPEPIEVAHPGLVYAGHLRRPGDASLAFDGSTHPGCEDGQNCCQGFDDCHSAFNLPELVNVNFNGQSIYAFNGLSLSFQYDYMVRLHVEYLEELGADETVFEAVEGVAPGNRVAWGDYDGDGDDDMLTSGPRLLRNDGGVFEDVSAQSGLSSSGAGGSGVWGDFDNDGCLDLFVFNGSNSQEDNLLRNNCDGTFSNVTQEAGVSDRRDHHDCEGNQMAPTPAAAWWDIDSDGFVDLYLANYECGSQSSYYPDTVWRNRGDGTFEEWTGRNGFFDVDGLRFAGRGAAPIDFDGDGDVDLMVNNYRLQENLFYLNNGDGTVAPYQRQLGLSGVGTRMGLSSTWGHSIGAAWGDLDGDLRFDLVVANLAHPRFYDFSDKTQVLMAQQDNTFVDIQGDFAQPMGAAGIRYQETHSVPTLADFDLDGHLDLVISAVYDGRPTDFYWGRGDGTFELDSYSAGIDATNGWGMAAADIDHDGDLDLAVNGALYRKRGGPEGHWFQVRAVGNVSSNRAALGATVTVESGQFSRVRHVVGGTGQGCQDSLYLHFGLGEVETIDRVLVRFPAGEQVVYEGPFDADQRLWAYEDGRSVLGLVSEP